MKDPSPLPAAQVNMSCQPSAAAGEWAQPDLGSRHPWYQELSSMDAHLKSDFGSIRNIQIICAVLEPLREGAREKLKKKKKKSTLYFGWNQTG